MYKFIKYQELKTLEKQVECILELYEQTRDDDLILWYKVIEHIKGEVNAKRYNLLSVCMLHKDLGIPKPEAVGRARRKVQEKRPDLKGNKQNRLEMVEVYESFANS